MDTRLTWIGCVALASAWVTGCSSDDGDGAAGAKKPTAPVTNVAGSGSWTAPNAPVTNTNPPAAMSGTNTPAGTGSSSNSQMGNPPVPTTGSQIPPAGMTNKPPSGMTGTMMPPPPMTMPPAPFSGPLDGDPNKPMVDIPGLKCGPLSGGFGAAPQSVKITNRDVVVGYPCAHEGAAVTFFLFVHGTLQEAQKVPFTMNAFAIHKLIDSHNVVMAVPKAVGTQWGNGDNGADLPHLYEVIDWIYSTFGTKFKIRSMWANGGSWGAAYLSNFACDPKLQDRLKGVQMIVGGGCPRCSSRLSCVVGQQELQLGNGMPLSPEQREQRADAANIAPYAMMHGCKGKMGPTDLGQNKYWVWPDCQPGWVHSYYLAPGQHADTWDMASVLKMTEEMKSTEP